MAWPPGCGCRRWRRGRAAAWRGAERKKARPKGKVPSRRGARGRFARSVGGRLLTPPVWYTRMVHRFGVPPAHLRSAPYMLRIDRITLREIRLALKEPFRISSGVQSERRILLLELEEFGGARTWSECVAMS